jgi:uncharacterized protein YggU (UPF0235/DUF167 family)
LVGGTRDTGIHGAEPLLVVGVRERAVEGAATAAAVAAIAEAFGVPRRDVTCVSGLTSRTKILRIDDPPADFDLILAKLRAG